MNERKTTLRELHRAIQQLCRELQGTHITTGDVLPYAQAIGKLFWVVAALEGPPAPPVDGPEGDKP